MKRLIIFLGLVTPHHLYAQQHTLPIWFIKAFKQHKLDVKYELKGYLKPSFFEADFNGDSGKDVVATIAEKKTHKRGLMLIDAISKRIYVFGAGTAFGDTQINDDYKWSQGWKLDKSSVAYKTLFDSEGGMSGRKVRLRYPGIFIYDVIDGSPYAGGLIYWNGSKYVWIHQGE